MWKAKNDPYLIDPSITRHLIRLKKKRILYPTSMKSIGLFSCFQAMNGSMKIGGLIFATKDSYLAQRPKHWGHLAALALERVQGTPSPYPPADWIIHLGAHTAPEEERVLDAPLWANPPQAIGLAIHYGIVLRAALRILNTDNYTHLIGHLSAMHVPVPSAQAMINAAHKLNLELKMAEADLHQHTLQHRPYFGARPPLRWPVLAG